MLNVLYEKFPTYVLINGKKYAIETDFREWIRFMELAEDETLPWQLKCRMMLRWYKVIPEDLESAIYALGDFLTADKLSNTDRGGEEFSVKGNRPAFSFTEDAGCIYAAFVESYGIDLQTVPYMHWWKFKTLFDYLPEKTEIKQRMMYRSIDANAIKNKEERKRVRRIQREIALHKKNRRMSDFDIGDMFA